VDGGAVDARSRRARGIGWQRGSRVGAEWEQSGEQSEEQCQGLDFRGEGESGGGGGRGRLLVCSIPHSQSTRCEKGEPDGRLHRRWGSQTGEAVGGGSPHSNRQAGDPCRTQCMWRGAGGHDSCAGWHSLPCSHVHVHTFTSSHVLEHGSLEDGRLRDRTPRGNQECIRNSFS
jgi:hypothetical protein